MLKAHETVYLFKWLFPEDIIKKQVEKKNSSRKGNANKGRYLKFKETFNSEGNNNNSSKYQDLFDNIDHDIEDMLEGDRSYNNEDMMEDDDID